ncbi:MAG: hypothetical protein KDJ38_10615 [Gammaproteobacteria bacterium]|nr:hypothetical protein [Gammaproteobacteria bacterium]
MLDKTGEKQLKIQGIRPSEPLWKRVPCRDENGRALSDFRMLISGLRSRPAHEIQARVTKIQSVLARYQQTVVFADLNLRINLLWVSVRAEARLDMEIAAQIHDLIPEAKLLAAGVRSAY